MLENFLPLPPSMSRLEQEAIVTKTIFSNKSGRVRFRGSWWSARCDTIDPIKPGAIVYVVGIYNLTLLVELPDPPKPP